jgi:hypothetical protein
MRWIAAIALAGCGYSTYYPQRVEFHDDTGADIPCSATGGLPVSLHVTSTSSVDLGLSVVDAYQCTEIPVAVLPALQAIDLTTSEGLVFVARAPDGGFVTWFAVPQGLGSFDVSVP